MHKTLKDAGKMRVFSIHTPYHLFLSLLLSSNNKTNADDLLIFFSDWSIPEEFLNRLNAYYVTKMFQGNFQYSVDSFPRIKKIYNILSLKKVLREYQPREAFLFNDARVESQIIGHYVKNACQGRVHYVEDGSSAYVSYKMSHGRDLLKDTIKRCVFGKGFEKIERHGLYSLNDDGYFTFPSLIDRALQERFKDKACAIPLCTCSVEKVYSKEIKSIHSIIEKRNVDSKITLVFLPLSTACSFVDFAYYKQIAIKKGGSSLIIAKHHPREVQVIDNDYFETVLPNWIPAEIVLLVAKIMLECGTIKSVTIVGDISTSLLTAKYLLGDHCKIYSVHSDSLSPYLKRLEPVFQALKIVQIKHPRKVVRIS